MYFYIPTFPLDRPRDSLVNKIILLLYHNRFSEKKYRKSALGFTREYIYCTYYYMSVFLYFSYNVYQNT